MTKSDIIAALKEACTRAGTQSNLAVKVGMGQGQISDYLCGRRDIENMEVRTLLRLFPDLKMIFFNDADPPRDNTPLVDSPIDSKLFKVIKDLSDEEKLDLMMNAAILKEQRNKKSSPSKIRENKVV